MWRKLRRMALYVAVVGGLLGLCAYVARDAVCDVLGHTASAWLSRRLNGTLEIGALRGSLWSSLVWRDVVLRDRAGLEAITCECYEVLRNRFEELLGRAPRVR